MEHLSRANRDSCLALSKKVAYTSELMSTYKERILTIVSLFALSKESSVPFGKRNFCSTSLTNVALVFSGFWFFMRTIIMIFVLWSIGKHKFFKLIYIDVFMRLEKPKHDYMATESWRVWGKEYRNHAYPGDSKHLLTPEAAQRRRKCKNEVQKWYISAKTKCQSDARVYNKTYW